MAEQIVIEFSADATQLVPAIDLLEQMGQIDSKAADAFRKSNAELAKKQAIIKANTAEEQKQIKTLNDVEKAVDAASSSFIQGFGKTVSDELKETGININGLDNSLKDLGNQEDNTGEKTKSLRTRIKEAKQELVDMAEAGLQGTPAFITLQRHAGELDDQMRDLNATVKGLGSDTRHIDGLISLAGGVAGGFAVAQGAAALFGSENEEVQKTLLKVNAAMSILQGLQQIQQLMQKESAASLLLSDLLRKKDVVNLEAQTVATGELAASQGVQTAITEAQIVATEGAEVANEGLNATMLANPIVIVITSLLALIEIYKAVTDDSKEVAAAQRLYNQAIKEGTEYLDADLTAIEHNIALQSALAKERGASAAEITKIEAASLNGRLQKIEEARQKEAAAINESFKNKKISSDEFKKLQEQEASLQKKYDDERNALLVKASEYRKTIADGELKSFISDQEAKILATQSGSIAEKEAQINELNITKDARIKLAKESATTEAEANAASNKIIAEDARQTADLRLQIYSYSLKSIAALDEADISRKKIDLANNLTDTITSIEAVTAAEIKAIKSRTNEQLKSDPNLSQGERARIQAGADLQILTLEKQQQVKLLEIKKAGINAQLILAEKGTINEFDKKNELIDQEQAIELAAVGLAQEQIAEIKAKYDKQRQEALKALQEAEMQNEISYTNAKLNSFGLTEEKKLGIVIDRLQIQRNLEITQAEGNAAKIAEINTKYDLQNVESKKATIKAISDYNLRMYDAMSANAIAYNQRAISQDKYTYDQKVAASKQLLTIEYLRLEQEKDALIKQRDKELEAVGNNLEKQQEIKEKYSTTILEIDNKEKAAKIKSEEEITAMTLKEINKRTAGIQAALNIFQKSLQATLGTVGFTVAISGIQNLGNSVQDILAKIKAGTMSTKEGIKEIATMAIQTVSDITNQVFADQATARQQALSEKISQLEEEKQHELNAKNLTEAQKQDINKKYAEREKQEKIKAFNADKEAKKEQAIINGALAITMTFAQLGIGGFLMAALIAAVTYVQVAKINATQPPKFRYGKVDIQGPGTTTSDSIDAKISKGESVIKADSTAKWKDALIAINNDSFEHYLAANLDKFVIPNVPKGMMESSYQLNNTKHIPIDYDKLATAVADKMKGIIPAPVSTHVNIDKDGIHAIVVEGSSKTEIKNNHFAI